jgi:hypothetical protein
MYVAADKRGISINTHSAASPQALSQLLNRGLLTMSSHMPPVPPANRTNKGSASPRKLRKRNNPEGTENRTVKQTEQRHNAAEEGETANVKQNTTNKGFFRGRRKG